MSIKYLLMVALAVSSCAEAAWQKLAEIPSTKYSVSTQKIQFTQLSNVEAHDIVATKELAVMNGGRVLVMLKPGDSVLQDNRPSVLPADVNWFGPVCSMGNAFAIGVHNYPESIESKNNETPRGGYRAAPEPLGFLLLMPTGEQRYLKELQVVSRPLQTFSEGASATGSSSFSDSGQSCAWDGSAMVIGSYGSLGKINFERATIDILDEDEGLAFSRFPLLVESNKTWVALDEGGLGGAFLSMRPNHGDPRSFGISNEDDIVSYSALARHRGELFVGTSHGLFMLNEKSGHFLRLDLGKKLSGEQVTQLVSHQKRLWAFIGGEWLGIDVQHRQAVRYVNSTPIKLTTGVTFDGCWLLAGVDGIWRARCGKKK